MRCDELRRRPTAGRGRGRPGAPLSFKVTLKLIDAVTDAGSCGGDIYEYAHTRAAEGERAYEPAPHAKFHPLRPDSPSVEPINMGERGLFKKTSIPLES
ncbi:hypothetical protein EVAR_66013_1 [Eumeta japonica]|uniref:Uncharacterized protein n=1 Tax=Eumeta variegata TaxID=151549 RepID=A0A4C1Z9F0_EUMVA|nr:hypothetical protein EVAR_66013_1 [Eumeta japonica]